MNLLRRLFGKGEEVSQVKTGLEAVETVVLPKAAAVETQSHLRAPGRGGNEGLVVWSGAQDGKVFRVRTVTFPDQRPIRSGNGVCVTLDGEALYRLNVWLHENGERMIAQVHSHPGHAYHSEMDDDYAVVTTVGSLSIVVPDFAVRPFSMGENATYRLSPRGMWIEVPPAAAKRLITIAED